MASSSQKAVVIAAGAAGALAMYYAFFKKPAKVSPAGKVVLITGAAQGIGEATTLLLDAVGFEVIAGVRRAEDGEKLRAKASSRLKTIILDVTKPDDIARAVTTVRDITAGRGLWALINNAGIEFLGTFEVLPTEKIRQMFEVNFFGVLEMTKTLLPLLALARGRVVLLSSLAGFISLPGQFGYSATKHAIEAFADSIRLEFRPLGVKVVKIQPGWVWTAFNTRELGTEYLDDPNLNPDARKRAIAVFEARTKFIDHDKHNFTKAEDIGRVVVEAVSLVEPRPDYPAGYQSTIAVLSDHFLTDRFRDPILIRSLRCSALE